MNRIAVVLTSIILTACLATRAQAAHYSLQKVTDGVYAAVALPNGKAASNAMVVVTNYQVILVGSHFLAETIKELTVEIFKITPLPLRHVILTHHHQGFNHIDFDLPANVEVITSWQTWRALNSGQRALKNQVIIFDRQLTLQRDNVSLVLSNTESGHSEGDVIAFIPSKGVVFASDLLFNDAIGFMGDGHMRDWILNLDLLEQLGGRVVIPGVGQVTDTSSIERFRTFLRDFLTSVLQGIEKKHSLAQIKKELALPRYASLPGYRTFMEVNIERAYKELRE